ncbi:hypothetical protein ABMA27_015182 [Loxostege sticticalis]|uniref:Uncharacterized protein n=1 Tax=Loxostege sticticalis TaxID=481309 RepID=A0ABR3I6Q5_LOXSC
MWKFFAALMLIGVVAGRVTHPYNEARLREAMERECKKYGADDHVDKAVDGVVTFMNCVSNYTDHEALARISNMPNEDQPDELLNFVKLTCKNQAEINACFSNVIDAISPCTDPKEKDNIQVAKKSMMEMTDLFCKDNSKSFSEFINDGAFACIDDKVYDLVMCTSTIQHLDNYQTLTTEQACAAVGEVTTCIVTALESCPKPSTAAFVRALFRTTFKSTSCSILAEEENKIAVNKI